MKYLKIVNIQTPIGEIDYKGLDIDKFVAGSQVYAYDLSECLVASNETYTGKHDDIMILTESEYLAEKQRLNNENSTQKPDPQSELEQLRAENLEIKLALAKLAEIVAGGN